MPERRICIVGGIFDAPEDYRRKLLFTPETVLARSMRDRGHAVTTVGHRRFTVGNEHDIVHVHHLGRAAALMATAPVRARFVYTGHHDPRLLAPRGIGNRRGLNTMRLAARLVLNRADAIVALSEGERRCLQRLFPHEAGKIRTIPNGLPEGIFAPPDERPGRRRVDRILFVGQLIELKGVDVLLDALPTIAREHEVELLLVYQNAALEGRYRDRVARSGLAERVQFLGFKSAHELAALYREVDLLVLPSFHEGLPTVITEALLSGVPVVASRVGGIPEQVGPHGVLVEPGDAEGLARGVARALEAIAGRRFDADGIGAYARARFGATAMVEAHLRLYEELLGARGGATRNRPCHRPANALWQSLLRTIGPRLTGRGLLLG